MRSLLRKRKEGREEERKGRKNLIESLWCVHVGWGSFGASGRNPGRGAVLQWVSVMQWVSVVLVLTT